MASGENDEVQEVVQVPACVRFVKKGKSENVLVAVVKPSSDFPVGVAISTVDAWIRTQNCDGWQFRNDEIVRLAREIRKLDDTKEYTVAERKDCKIEIQVSPDRLQAWIRVLPAFGGVALTESLLAEELERYGIHFGIKEELRAKILQDGQCERELIAEGIVPVPGEPARFEPLVHESEHKGIPQAKEHGRVDYKELGLFLSVTPNTPLLRRTAPTQGTAGRAIDGTEIPSSMGADRALRPGPGTAISKEDPDVVIAIKGGQPAFEENFVRVDPTLEIEGVNPSTGNVTFDGNILVHGTVEAGYKVTASQDLTILDTVEGADLSAGKNLILMTGLYGKGKSKITVGGNLEARFLSECSVRCNGNVEVADLIAHCLLECGGSVFLGRSGGKGQVFGGKILALKEVQAKILGSVSESATLIELGVFKELLHRSAQIEQELAEIQPRLELLEGRLQSVASPDSEHEKAAVAKLKEAAVIMTEKIAALKNELASIQKKMAIAQNGKIKGSEVHRGVILCAGKHKQIVNDVATDLCFQPPPEEKPAQEPPPTPKENA